MGKDIYSHLPADLLRNAREAFTGLGRIVSDEGKDIVDVELPEEGAEMLDNAFRDGIDLVRKNGSRDSEGNRYATVPLTIDRSTVQLIADFPRGYVLGGPATLKIESLSPQVQGPYATAGRRRFVLVEMDGVIITDPQGTDKKITMVDAKTLKINRRPVGEPVPRHIGDLVKFAQGALQSP